MLNNMLRLVSYGAARSAAPNGYAVGPQSFGGPSTAYSARDSFAPSRAAYNQLGMPMLLPPVAPPPLPPLPPLPPPPLPPTMLPPPLVFAPPAPVYSPAPVAYQPPVQGYYPAPAPGYYPAPSQPYYPAPVQGYNPTYAPAYNPAPVQGYNPTYAPAYSPAPAPTYYPAPAPGYYAPPVQAYNPAPAPTYYPAQAPANYPPVAPVQGPAQPSPAYGEPWSPSVGQLQGADTSHWQSDAQFAASIKGTQWTALKATQGTTYTDPNFQSRWAQLGAKVNSGQMALRMAFLFLDPGNGTGQAQHFLNVLGLNGQLPAGTRLALDWETAALKSPATLRDAATYIHQVTGLWPVIYVQASALAAAKAAVPEAPIWEASWGKGTKTDVPFFQYSDGPGYDHDVFNGGLDALKRFAGWN